MLLHDLILTTHSQHLFSNPIINLPKSCSKPVHATSGHKKVSKWFPTHEYVQLYKNAITYDLLYFATSHSKAKNSLLSSTRFPLSCSRVSARVNASFEMQKCLRVTPLKCSRNMLHALLLQLVSATTRSVHTPDDAPAARWEKCVTLTACIIRGEVFRRHVRRK